MQDLTVKTYEYLPREALALREEVFLVEQGFEIERDEIDDIAEHIVIYDKDIVVGVARLYVSDGMTIGRICVKKDYRSKGLGGLLLDTGEKIARDKGHDTIKLHAQTRATAFYARYGYVAYGEVAYEEWCEHIWMKKSL